MLKNLHFLKSYCQIQITLIKIIHFQLSLISCHWMTSSCGCMLMNVKPIWQDTTNCDTRQQLRWEPSHVMGLMRVKVWYVHFQVQCLNFVFFTLSAVTKDDKILNNILSVATLIRAPRHHFRPPMFWLSVMKF